jgi:hypothetical protein
VEGRNTSALAQFQPIFTFIIILTCPANKIDFPLKNKNKQKQIGRVLNGEKKREKWTACYKT